MNIRTEYKYYESYLPTPRHQKLRWREATDSITVTVPEITEADAPLVLQVGSFNIYSAQQELEDIRLYKGQLYRVAYCHDYYAGGPHAPLPVDEMILYVIKRRTPVGPNEGSKKRAIQHVVESAARFAVIDGVVYHRCNEPLYCIHTLGLGCNHGGTHLSIEWGYNSNIPNARYFNALQRIPALTAAKNIALTRGDTNSVERIGDDIIVVHDKSVVKRNPMKDHGEGDPFLNMIDAITMGATSASEAAAIVMAVTAAEINK